jgi:hypothetical protein
MAISQIEEAHKKLVDKSWQYFCLSVVEAETRPTLNAADECQVCGAIGMFSDDVCIECGTRR